MNEHAKLNAYAAVVEQATLKLERLLPGPAERVWSYLTDSELRRQWLAAGPMDLTIDGSMELVWRNDELTDPPGIRPEGFGEEHRMQSRVTEIDPPRKLAFAWGPGEVSFTLEPKGEDVLLTVIHKRISDRANMVKIGAGWHAHLDILKARLEEAAPKPFWDVWSRLRDEYETMIPS